MKGMDCRPKPFTVLYSIESICFVSILIWFCIVFVPLWYYRVHVCVKRTNYSHLLRFRTNFRSEIYTDIFCARFQYNTYALCPLYVIEVLLISNNSIPFEFFFRFIFKNAQNSCIKTHTHAYSHHYVYQVNLNETL